MDKDFKKSAIWLLSIYFFGPFVLVGIVMVYNLLTGNY